MTDLSRGVGLQLDVSRETGRIRVATFSVLEKRLLLPQTIHMVLLSFRGRHETPCHFTAPGNVKQASLEPTRCFSAALSAHASGSRCVRTLYRELHTIAIGHI